MENIERVREFFPITKQLTYLNNAATGPWPIQVSREMEAFIKAPLGEYEYGDGAWNERVDDARRLFADLVGCEENELAFVPNTSYALNAVASLLLERKGRNVVFNDLEFPSNVLPWIRQKKRGLELRCVMSKDGRVLTEDVEKAVDDKTWAVAASFVEYGNGFKNDLRALSEIVHEHGAYLVVDGVQGVGEVDIDVKRSGVDFMACASYKWLVSPAGTGFLYVDRRLIEEFEPLFAGWRSLAPEAFDEPQGFEVPQSIKWRGDAERFELGARPTLQIVGLRAALSLILDLGMPSIESRIRELTDYLVDKLRDLKFSIQTPLEDKHRSAIVNFKHGDPVDTVNKLRSKGVVTAPRDRGIRVSPHFYNDESDIDALIAALRKIV